MANVLVHTPRSFARRTVSGVRVGSFVRINNRFSVDFEYPVYFTDDFFSSVPDIVSMLFSSHDGLRRRAAVFVDSGLKKADPDLCERIRSIFSGRDSKIGLACEIAVVRGGPEAKRSESVFSKIISVLSKASLDRQEFVVAVGGGSVLDAVGFAASMIHRGLRIIRFPSTVLSQCDAGVGVKNGLDRFGQKNFLGTFSPPFAVVNDTKLLSTLPDAELRSGFSEAVKVAVIKDGQFFARMENLAPRLCSGDMPAVREALETCAAIHLRQITSGGDPFEFGTARPLDFGHWAAHRLEILSDGRISHGFAVAAGIALDSVYANLSGMLSDNDTARITNLLRALKLPLWYPEMEIKETNGEFSLLKGVDDFRNHLGGRLNVTLPVSIGHAVEIHEMETAKIKAALSRVREVCS